MSEADRPALRPLAGELRTLDQHIHAGLERIPALDELVAFLIRDGRRIIGLLDHSFLFDYDPDKLAAWREKHHVPAHYPPGRAGFHAFVQDVARLKAQPPAPGVTILQGLEFYDRDVPEAGLVALPDELLAPLDFVAHEFKLDGFGESDEVVGARLARAAREMRALYAARGIPGFICHPFRVTYSAMAAAGALDDPGLAGRGVFTKPAVERWLAELDPESCLIEINHRALASKVAASPLFTEMVAITLQQLKAGGARFSFGSDLHATYNFTLPPGRDPNYDPERLAAAVGLSRDDFWQFAGPIARAA